MAKRKSGKIEYNWARDKRKEPAQQTAACAGCGFPMALPFGGVVGEVYCWACNYDKRATGETGGQHGKDP